MPSKSPAQHRFMEAAAHTKGGFGGVPQKVGKEFVKADKRLPKGNIVKKVKKMADGGMSSLGDMVPVGQSPTTPQVGTTSSGSVGGRGSASDGLSTVNKGAQTVGDALSRAQADIGGFKKGGQVTTRRMSTCSPSKKSPNW